MSGWLTGHFQLLVKGSGVHHLPKCMITILTSFFNNLIRGVIPPSIRRFFLASRLVGTPKGDGGVRPIAMGNVITKLVGKSVMLKLKGDTSQIFPSIQLGVGKSLGTEQLVHSLRHAWGNKGHVLCLDVRNAFNSMSRHALFIAVAEQVPQLLPYFLLIYGQSSPLMTLTRDGVFELESAEGVKQGGPLSSFLFCLALHQVLVKGCEVEGVEGVAYCDDMNFYSSSLESLEVVYRLVESNLEEIGLKLRADKSKLLVNPEGNCGNFEVEGVEHVVEGLVGCGSPIGSEIFMRSFYNDMICDVTKQAELLIGYRGSNDDGSELRIIEAFTLFRQCLASSFNYLLRTTPIGSEAREEFIRHLSQLLDSILERICGGVGDVNLVHLPIGMGGVGIPSPALTADIAYLSSRAQCSVLYGGSWGDILEISEKVPESVGMIPPVPPPRTLR